METTASALRQQLSERLDQLTPAQQQHILQVITDLLPPAQHPNRWGHLAGFITPEDAEMMQQASLECRQIEPDNTLTW